MNDKLPEEEPKTAEVWTMNIPYKGSILHIHWRIDNARQMIQEILKDAINEEDFDTPLQRIAEFIGNPERIDETQKKQGPGLVDRMGRRL